MNRNHGLPVLKLDGFLKEQDNSFIYVNKLADHLTKNHDLISTPHKHNFYLTVLFTSGSGTHNVDFESYPVTPGSLFVLKPGQSHHWELSKDTSGFILFHSDYSLNQLQRQSFAFHAFTPMKPLIDNLSKDDIDEVVRIFNSLFDEYSSNRAYRDRMLINTIDILYIHLARVYQSLPTELMETSSALIYISRFEQLLQNDLSSEKNPSYYAEKLSISPRHLNRLVNECFGMSTSDYIAGNVTLEAKRLLALSTLQLKEIAEQLGFDDYAYFSKYFKKHTGVSPVAFRKSIK